MAGPCEREPGSKRACKTVLLGAVQALQPKACVDCGATKTPLWRCNVDGVKSLCNRCGVRLYREQRRAPATDDPLSLEADDRDDSSSCTYPACNISSAESQPSPAGQKRQAAQQGPSSLPVQDKARVCKRGMQAALGVDLQDAPAKCTRSSASSDRDELFLQEFSPYSSGSDDDLVLMAPAIQSAPSPIIIEAQQALKQAWPSLARGPLGHLWEAGLDPLDPLFLANINDPTACQAKEEEEESQNEIGLLLQSMSSNRSAERFPSVF